MENFTMAVVDTARQFFDACEAGKGWDVCQAWCHGDATFACQADTLADTKTLQAYTEWMKGLLGPIPDGRYELKCFAADPDRNTVSPGGMSDVRFWIAKRTTRRLRCYDRA
jgi:hypothetical protein